MKDNIALRLRKQKDLLIQFFLKEIDSDYIYIDVPLHNNIGDWLIALGAWECLKCVPYRCVDKVSWEYIDESKIKENTIILFHGGGNFGDLWRGATDGRNEMISRYSKNKIIILPQTITYTDTSLMQTDAAIYKEHKNLHICVRDSASYDIAKKYFSTNSIYLLPDTAVGMYDLLPKNENTQSAMVCVGGGMY